MPDELPSHPRVETAAGAERAGAMGNLRRLLNQNAHPNTIYAAIRKLFPNLREGEAKQLFDKARAPFEAGKALSKLPAGQKLPASEIPRKQRDPNVSSIGNEPGYIYVVKIGWRYGPNEQIRWFTTTIHSLTNLSSDRVIALARLMWEARTANRVNYSTRYKRREPDIEEIKIHTVWHVTRAPGDPRP